MEVVDKLENEIIRVSCTGGDVHKSIDGFHKEAEDIRSAIECIDDAKNSGTIILQGELNRINKKYRESCMTKFISVDALRSILSKYNITDKKVPIPKPKLQTDIFEGHNKIGTLVPLDRE